MNREVDQLLHRIRTECETLLEGFDDVCQRRGRKGLHELRIEVTAIVALFFSIVAAYGLIASGVFASAAVMSLLLFRVRQRNAPMIELLRRAEALWRRAPAPVRGENPVEAFTDPETRAAMLDEYARRFARVERTTRSGAFVVDEAGARRSRSAATFVFFAASLQALTRTRLECDATAFRLRYHKLDQVKLMDADHVLSTLYGNLTLPYSAAQCEQLRHAAVEAQYMLLRLAGDPLAPLTLDLEGSAYKLRVRVNEDVIEAGTVVEDTTEGAMLRYPEVNVFRRTWDSQLSAPARTRLTQFLDMHAAALRLARTGHASV